MWKQFGLLKTISKFSGTGFHSEDFYPTKTLAKITERERVEKTPWHALALREAIINALGHNDYSREIAPKFEIFDDRMEITSYGGLPVGFSQDEFFQGYSVPRNKEIMRIFRDLELVEQLGSGIPLILKYYPIHPGIRLLSRHSGSTFPYEWTVFQALNLVEMRNGPQDIPHNLA